eukprot:gene13313-17836_t
MKRIFIYILAAYLLYQEALDSEIYRNRPLVNMSLGLYSYENGIKYFYNYEKDVFNSKLFFSISLDLSNLVKISTGNGGNLNELLDNSFLCYFAHNAANRNDESIYSFQLFMTKLNQFGYVEENKLIDSLHHHNYYSCSRDLEFIVKGFQSGTHRIVTYFKVPNINNICNIWFGSSQNESSSSPYIIIGASSKIIDVIDIDHINSFRRNNHIYNMSIFQYPDSNNIINNYRNKCYLSSFINSVILSTSSEDTAQYPKNYYNSLIELGNNNNYPFSSINHPATRRSTRVGIFIKDFSFHGTNHRFFLWLCNYQYFMSRGNYRLTIITDAENNAMKFRTFEKNFNFNFWQSCSDIEISYHEGLSYDYSFSFVNELSSPSDYSNDSRLEPHRLLVKYLKDNFEIIIAANTGGDVQTHHLIVAVNNAKNKNNELSANITSFPLMAIDLPNLVIPNVWNSKIDFLLAPSRFVGWHPTSIAHHKPIISIYPPFPSLKHVHRWDAEFMNNLDLKTIVDDCDESDMRDKALHRIRFGFIGSIVNYRNFGLILRAVKYILSGQYCNETSQSLVEKTECIEDVNLFQNEVKIRFFGDGNSMDVLEDLIRELKLSEVVELFGHQSHPQLMRILSCSLDVIVNPIVEGETFGFTFLEAIAHNIPIITFNTGSSEEILRLGIMIEVDSNSSSFTPFQVVVDLANAMFLFYRNKKMGNYQTNNHDSLDYDDILKSRMANFNFYADDLMDAIDILLLK